MALGEEDWLCIGVDIRLRMEGRLVGERCDETPLHRLIDGLLRGWEAARVG